MSEETEETTFVEGIPSPIHAKPRAGPLSTATMDKGWRGRKPLPYTPITVDGMAGMVSIWKLSPAALEALRTNGHNIVLTMVIERDTGGPSFALSVPFISPEIDPGAWGVGLPSAIPTDDEAEVERALAEKERATEAELAAELADKIMRDQERDDEAEFGRIEAEWEAERMAEREREAQEEREREAQEEREADNLAEHTRG